MTNVFLGGVPTGPDVELLLNKYGRPNAGDRYSYEQIAADLRIAVKAHRFRTVTSAWRREIYRRYNVLISCENGIGFVVLSDRERLGSGFGTFKRGIRQIRRSNAVVVGCNEDNLSEGERERKAHIARVSGHLLLVERSEARRLTPKSEPVGA